MQTISIITKNISSTAKTILMMAAALFPVLNLLADDKKDINVQIGGGHDGGGAFYMQWWFWVLIALVFIIVIVAITRGGKKA